ncbi:TlpA family protein disulfide reductase [Salegentibacter mishustinae]|uniref:TlpA family protein disulfide reductase n=1 Tax=Salegentibacter mishustinae TaxID=270918 RepID=UPI0024911181|nr:TlpA disulfide reductase family protein [Salegentibacter mishustinae]
MKKLFKNQWSNIIFIVIILAMIIPQTRKPIQIVVNKIFAFSPSATDEEDRKELETYNWALETASGKRVDFAESKGKVIIVNYWATWCPPCIAEMPSFQELYTDYKDEVEFYFISGEDHETTNNFLKRKGYRFSSYRMLSEDPKPLDGYTLPSTYVIDKNGTIVVDKKGAADWNSQNFRNLLNQLLAE